MINTINLPPFKKMCITIGNLPTSFMESMTYYEALCWLYDYFEKTLLPAINTNSEAITELQTAFVTLKNYIDTYFDNLDVQQEVNNKLDDMAESGQLTDIIAQYLGLAGVLAYNTVADMKAAENLAEGSIAKTLGYHSIGDGGMATYKIREVINTDDVNEMDIIALNDENLVAELIYEYPINPKKLGAYGDGTHDDLAVLNYAITQGNVKLSDGIYYISDAINVGMNRIFDGNEATLIPADGKYAIEVIGVPNDPVKQVNIRDLLIDCTTNGGNGIDLEYTYFVYIDNVNINRLSKNGAIGINQVGGFNSSITNSRVIGNRTYTNTYGIKITTDTGGTANMTNNKYDTLLIQNLTYGINANYGTTSNVNEFNNIGFSNNNYCFYISGYTDPILFSNIRMEDIENVADSTGFYITGSIESTLRDLNAYNIKRVIDNHGDSDKRMIIEGSISLTGTSQTNKFLFIYNSSQNIYYNANDRILGATYNFDISTSFTGSAVLVNGNGFLPYSSDITSGTTTISPNNKFIYKITTANLTNLYGRKNSECMIYTTESNIKVVGTPSSLTNMGAELTLVPYRLYHVKFMDLNKFIISD